MAEIFKSIDLRRIIFNFKTTIIRQNTKQNYKELLNEFEEHLNGMYRTREYQLWSSLDETQIANLSQNEYFNSMIEELTKDKYFNMSNWLLDWIIEY